jgi:hypothetical protein
MAYEIRVVEGGRSTIEKTLNETASEGWQLVSCWPEKENVVGVFQRPAVVSSSRPPEAPKSAPAPSPASAPMPITLEIVLAACLAMPLKKSDKGVEFREGISVAQFASQQGVTKEAMLNTLQELGLKAKKEENDKNYAVFVKNHALWLKQAGKHAAWYVNMAVTKPRK